MKKTIQKIILLVLGFYSCGQKDAPAKDKAGDNIQIIEKITFDESKINIHEFNNYTFFHSEAIYTDSSGKGIIIQNGFPRGGGSLFDSSDIPRYGHAVFWSRIINRTDTPTEITIKFPADSIAISPSPDSHIKLLVPPDTMTLDKISKFSYGLENVKSFAESNLYQKSQIKRIINPNEDSMFYVVLLSHFPSTNQVISRTGLFLKEQEFFYRLTIDSLTSKIIPSGQITFRKEGDD